MPTFKARHTLGTSRRDLSQGLMPRKLTDYWYLWLVPEIDQISLMGGTSCRDQKCGPWQEFRKHEYTLGHRSPKQDPATSSPVCADLNALEPPVKCCVIFYELYHAWALITRITQMAHRSGVNILDFSCCHLSRVLHVTLWSSSKPRRQQ